MKSISNLLSSLVSKQHTPFVQKLNNSSLMQNNPIILMTDILYLIECFEGFGPECNGIYLTGQEYLQQFFKAITNKQLNGFIAIKITLTIHLILYEFQIGDCIADEMIKEGSALRIQQNQQFSMFVQNYLMYLLKLAQNLKLFYACKIGQYPIFDQDQTYTQCSENTRDQQFQQFQILKKNNNFRDTNLQYRNYQQKKLELHLQQQTGCIQKLRKNLLQMITRIIVKTNKKFLRIYQRFIQKVIKQIFLFSSPRIIQMNQSFFAKSLEQQIKQNEILNNITIEQKILYLFKLHNLLNQCIQILNLCINTLKQLENQDSKNIFIEISCVLWNDCMVMFKFSTQELCKLLDSFRFMPLQQLLSIQQIYWVTINSSDQIKWLYNNRKYFDSQNIVKQPFWFEENKKLSQEIQNSIIDNKMLQVPDSTRNVNKLSTPQAQQNQKSPSNFAQPFTSRIGNSQNSTKTTIPLQPYFIANKKLQQHQTIETQQPMSTRAKNIVGSIFSDEQLTLSPRESSKQQKLQ